MTNGKWRYYLIGVLVFINIILFIAVNRFVDSGNSVEKSQLKNAEPISLDSELRSLFYSYGIPDQWIRERSYAEGHRKELRVWIPNEISFTVINLEIHQLAERLRYQTSAREDSRTGNLSIHIRSGDVIIMSVLIRPRSDLKRREHQFKSFNEVID